VAHDPLAALRQRNFRIYAASLFVYGISTTMLPAIIALQVYDITGSATKLGIIGLVRFAPALVMALFAGAVVDSYDRRRISQLAQCVTILCALTLFFLSVTDQVSLGIIYGVVFVMALAAAFDNPARQALLPMLVTRETFQNAITVSGTIRQLGFVFGPTVAGTTAALWGYGYGYLTDAGLILISVIAMFFLRPRDIEAPRKAVSMEAIKEGIAFVRSKHIILGCMTLDMFAVVFGGATALLPIYAKDILGVGDFGYGLLYASLDVGALVMSLFLIMAPPAKHPGVWLMWAVLGFGVFTMLFGLSRSFPLSMALYALIGMADQVSVVMRNTTIQLNTPDELRGRVGSVNSLFIGASNQIGQAESGFVAGLTSATFAVVSGGAGCLAVLGIVWAKIPEMRRYQVDYSPALKESEPEPKPAAAS